MLFNNPFGVLYLYDPVHFDKCTLFNTYNPETEYIWANQAWKASENFTHKIYLSHQSQKLAWTLFFQKFIPVSQQPVA